VVSRVEPFRPEHLPQVRALANCHLNAAVPGWSLPEAYIASRLGLQPEERVVDPWVVERATLCALERGQVVVAAHLLRYGDGAEVSDAYRSVGEIAWQVAWPSHRQAAAELLAAANARLAAWRVRTRWAGGGLPVPVLTGVPEGWPHIAAALREAGFRLTPERAEAIYGGDLGRVPAPTAAPVAGVDLRRTVADTTVAFTVVLDGRELGVCEWDLDLTQGGARPALRGWAELANLHVEVDWRGRGLGTWLVGHGVAWLRLGRCERVVLTTAADDEAAGSSRFYRRLGWDVLARLERAWGYQAGGQGAAPGGEI
jgi:GNAT superfamily N-acetyltransferase